MKPAFEHDTLGNRMKALESLSTSRNLMLGTPVYARIDGRAFHTFCRGLEKPFSKTFIGAMQFVTMRLVKDFNAILGYVQSDEISLGWLDLSKAPFNGRVQKLESVLASAAAAYFNYFIFGTDNGAGLRGRALKHIPTFDCRCFNVPTVEELANSFLWRENDAIKNSVTGMALNFFSDKEIEGKNTDDKVHMMRMKGYCFYEDTDEAFLRGSFFQRQVFQKELTEEDLSRIPEKVRPQQGDGGKVLVTRSEIRKLHIPYRLTDIANKTGVLFNGEVAELNKENPTFIIKESAK